MIKGISKKGIRKATRPKTDRRRRSFTEQERERIGQLAAEGYPATSIATKLQCGWEILQKELQRDVKCWEAYKSGVLKFLDKVRELEEKGLSPMEIAVECDRGCNAGHWWGYVKRMKREFLPQDRRKRHHIPVPLPPPRKWAYHANKTRYPMRHGEPDLIAWCSRSR